MLKALVTFEDGWENFYHYRAYFLAAAGIAEFQDGSSTDGIEDVFCRMWIEEWQEESGIDGTVSQAVEESAEKLYGSIDANVIVSNLVRIGLHCYKLYFSSDWRQCIGFSVAEGARVVLEETHRSRAIALLAWLIQSVQSEALQAYAVEILGNLTATNETAVKALELLAENIQNEILSLEATENLLKINPNNEIACNVLTNLIENSPH